MQQNAFQQSTFQKMMTLAWLLANHKWRAFVVSKLKHVVRKSARSRMHAWMDTWDCNGNCFECQVALHRQQHAEK